VLGERDDEGVLLWDLVGVGVRLGDRVGVEEREGVRVPDGAREHEGQGGRVGPWVTTVAVTTVTVTTVAEEVSVVGGVGEGCCGKKSSVAVEDGS